MRARNQSAERMTDAEVGGFEAFEGCKMLITKSYLPLDMYILINKYDIEISIFTNDKQSSICGQS